MKTHITILTGKIPSTKHYSIVEGKARKGKSEFGKIYNSETLTIEGLDELYEVLAKVSHNPRQYIIRGKGLTDKQSEVRRTKNSELKSGYFNEERTAWLCFDFDEALTPAVDRLSTEAIEWLVQNRLPDEFHGVSYIYQFSCTSGLEYLNTPIKQGTNVHIFFYLNKAVGWDELKRWFSKEIDAFNECHSNGIDPATLRTVTPIFINTQVIKNKRIIDKLSGKQRINIILKKKDEVEVPAIPDPVEKHSSFSLDDDVNNAILEELDDIGCFYGKAGGAYKLYHPYEKTPGDWFVYPDGPQVVHHHTKKSMSVWKWVKEFWNTELKTPYQNTMTNKKPLSIWKKEKQHEFKKKMTQSLPVRKLGQ